MTDLNPRDIVTINLKYGSAASPRKILAFSQLCAKALYSANGPLREDKLRNNIASMLGVQKVSQQSVLSGLTLLEELSKISKHGNLWELTHVGRDEIAKDVERSRQNLEEVLDRHFPKSIDRPTLRLWFNETAAKVFGQYGDEWVASVCRGMRQTVSRSKSLANLLAPATKKYDLKTVTPVLEAGFLGFLRSDDLADQDYLMSLGQAMFSARLVATEIGADPITLDEFRGATVIVDTNLVFAFALEDHRLAKSVHALARALQSIEAKAVFLRPTQEEYARALNGIRPKVLSMVEVFPSEVIADTHNDFIVTAQARGCKTREEYERFFDELCEFPNEIVDGVPLSMMEDQEIVKSIEIANNDESLKQRIKAITIQLRPEWRRREKSELSLQHDAALIHVTEDERRRREKCWTLSLDRGVLASAIERAGPHTMPAVLSVDALVEILALEAAGPCVYPTDFAPLLARIIVNECAPLPSTYSIEDLQWLYSINQEVTELSPEYTKEIARTVSKARIEGAGANDPQLQLSVNRMFQAKREETGKRLQEAQDRLRMVDDEVQTVRAENEKLQRELVKHKTNDIMGFARKRLRNLLLWRIPVAAIGAVMLWLLVGWLTKSSQAQEAISTIISLLFLGGYLWKLIWEPIKNYKNELKTADKRAKTEVFGASEGDHEPTARETT